MGTRGAANAIAIRTCGIAALTRGPASPAKCDHAIGEQKGVGTAGVRRNENDLQSGRVDAQQFRPVGASPWVRHGICSKRHDLIALHDSGGRIDRKDRLIAPQVSFFDPQFPIRLG
jgi:hypothetical protein